MKPILNLSADDIMAQLVECVPNFSEGRNQELKLADWSPDFGPAEFVPSWGATVTGARKFLIAFNVNVIGTKEQAHRIALDIREQGRGKTQPGHLQKVQGMGWYLDESNMAQVSTNILDYELTPLHTVHQEICSIAQVVSQLVSAI
ncbi:formimidoyltransferase-cyclodeaminase-like [Perca flavescens]|uniref:formimidoyltransferase-cyclodeaminase-like n=1 Tax=Perca flavescens TaxID=8167 RepID=UPI00106DF374|nr:formimidoyltransferase-cyclodeaminase-like [Perca flavescens]XP_028427236.1 formimidoyltransferase-cyclodeaminase-like [Perca flavescens]XP_028427237.1 formimidoyltransferase-cyclodeaminase-like [Perca flavescens]